MTKELPDGQLLFKTGEIAERLDLQPSVVRYWEKEFAKHIRPIRLESGRRLYRKGDLEIFAEIKRLLRVERLTVQGAKLRIAQSQPPRRHRLFPDLPPEGEAAAGPAEAPQTPPPDPAAEDLRKLIGDVRLELFGLRDYLMLSPDRRPKRGPRPALGRGRKR
ncbi:MAG: MerR family transcriptional regulator [Deltaproteobacteria bacterium]|jgi:DNA-binding transcriptional MerR regulator|nr:MerR family transcriptional regulator [Deltaproteobacteria bacterium]